jgi:F0F1-type ATP synthase membrane subunit c/vacuolar-type H+-ATPase subunit K
VSAVDETSIEKPSDAVAGFLAALAIFVALLGLAWHPLRLIAPAIVISLVAAAMGGRHRQLAFAAVLIVASCFFFGLMIAVITSRALW